MQVNASSTLLSQQHRIPAPTCDGAFLCVAAFCKGHLEEAFELYTQAIGCNNLHTGLLLNRSLTALKLGEEPCDDNVKPIWGTVT